MFSSKTFIYPESHQEKCELPDTGEPATARLCALVQLSVKTGKLPPEKVGAPFCATLPLQAALLDFTIPDLSCLSPELLYVVYFSLEISLPAPSLVSVSLCLAHFLYFPLTCLPPFSPVSLDLFYTIISTLSWSLCPLHPDHRPFLIQASC